MHNFIDCLDGRGVKIFGIINDTATAFQFNLLRGAYATKLYSSCDGELAQQCIVSNITQVPAVIYENKGYTGVQSIPFLENLTACKF